MTSAAETSFTAAVIDMARKGAPDCDSLVPGFATLDDATAYAIARVRASVEALRKPGLTAPQLDFLWHLHGEDCRVLDSPVRGGDLLDIFIATPATPAECDWRRLTPTLRRFHATLLVFNKKRESVWAGGYYRAYRKSSPQALLARFGDDAAATFVRKGVEPSVPATIHVVSHFQLPDPPRPPPGDERPLRSWRVSVDFVCHDVKFGGSGTGVFAWPEEPNGAALDAMTHILVAQTLTMRGDGPEYASYSDVLSIKVAETDEAPYYPLD
jgi:hypothetical protein